MPIVQEGFDSLGLRLCRHIDVLGNLIMGVSDGRWH